MDPIIANFEYWTNVDFAESFLFVDGNGLPISLTGSTFDMDIKVAPGGSVILTPTLDTSQIASGIIGIGWADGALAAGTYVYDLIQITGGIRTPLMMGSITMSAGVTL